MKFRFLVALFAATLACHAQKRLVLVDEDGAGPGGTNQMAILALLQSPQVEVLGITTVTGDGWVDEETRHTLRMLELTGHANVPVARGANGPLVRTEKTTRLDEQTAGKAGWLGAWDKKPESTIAEGEPKQKPLEEDAAHFLIRQVHAHPHAVTIFAAGPLTNIALAITIDPGFAALTQGIVFMGASVNPHTSDPEFATDPRHEFNLWFDPEATHIVLHAAWPSVEATTADVSLKAPFTQGLLDRLGNSRAPAARYITQWSKPGSYMWDELTACAWLDPGIITRRERLYLDVDLSHGPSYGNVLTWTEKTKPATATQPAQVQMDLDRQKFENDFVQLMEK